MYYGTKRREVDNIYHTYGIDNSDVVEVSKWYCAAQWTLCQMGNVHSMEAVATHISLRDFRNICTILRLDAACLQQVTSVELIYSLCRFIQNYFLRGGAAKFFYRDYLSCSVADRSLFADSARIGGNDTISCTLIHLSLALAGNRLGTRKMFSLLPLDVYRSNKSDFAFLEVSYDEFEFYWNAVHYIDATSPMKVRQKINDAVKVYKKMKAPQSVLLSQYALVRHYESADLRRVTNPWEYCQRLSGSVIQEKGMSVDEKLFNEAAYQISRENPTDVVQAVFYKNRDDSKIESAMVRSELKRLIHITKNTLVVNPSPAFLVELNNGRQSIPRLSDLLADVKVVCDKVQSNDDPNL